MFEKMHVDISDVKVFMVLDSHGRVISQSTISGLEQSRVSAKV